MLRSHIAVAKAERGKYSLASPGAFTAQRFYHANVMKLFPESDLPYVAYNGGAEIVTALLGNHISAGFTPVVNFKPHKDIRVIAVCGAQRDPNYPDAPTFKEMFGDGFVFDSVYGIVAPLKTPKDRIERLQSLIKEALSDPDVQAKFAKVNMTTNYLPADEFGKVIEGMDIVDKIATVETSWGDRPVKPQIMKTVTVDTMGVDYPEPVHA